MYTLHDLRMLEEMTNKELQNALEEANQRIEYIQSLYEGEDDKNSFKPKVKMELILMNLKNVENYIRRIENLLNEYEIDRVFVRKAIQRRNKRFTRL